MSKIISVHSFRGGTGKSNTSANVAALLAADGRRVGVVDTDILSPGIHVLFGLGEDDIVHALNDYLYGKCGIIEIAQDVTPRLGAPIRGKVFLVPSSSKASEIARVLKEGYDAGLINDGFRELVQTLKLDVLIIDTHPGLNEETLLSIAVSDALAVVMRPDQQDYQGTAVTVDVARKLGVPNLSLVVNKVPSILNLAELKRKVESSYGCEVAGLVPHSDDVMFLASAGIFAMRYPDHTVTGIYRRIANKLVS